MRVLGRQDATGGQCHLGAHLARDGSAGGQVGLDIERPHVGLVVGKRGAGKSHTLGVIAEGLAKTAGVGGVVLDPMGGLTGLAENADITVRHSPQIRPNVLDPRSWCAILDVAPSKEVGGLVWGAAAARDSLDGMDGWIRDRGAGAARRAAINHIGLARSWGIFRRDATLGKTLLDETITVLDLAGLDRAPAAAIVRAVADGLYTAAVDSAVAPLPWLLLDEAHAFFDGPAGDGLRRLLTRGRQPGVSLIAATQRPGALPAVAISQADLLLAHRLTAAADVEALATARQTYHHEDLESRLPEGRGQALVVDDTAESVHTIAVRDRETPHRGRTPRAAERV